MNVLLDTNVLIDLDRIQKTGLIEKMYKNCGWKFYVPGAVMDELDRRHVEKPIQCLLDDGIILTREISRAEISDQRLGMLGKGECEAICVISQCPDKTYREYLFLTSDRKARRIAEELGMKSRDVLNFMLLCNENRQMSRKDSKDACIRLKSYNHMDDETVEDFVAHLQDI